MATGWGLVGGLGKGNGGRGLVSGHWIRGLLYERPVVGDWCRSVAWWRSLLYVFTTRVTLLQQCHPGVTASAPGTMGLVPGHFILSLALWYYLALSVQSLAMGVDKVTGKQAK